jgi:hypothetical protein
MPRMLGARGDRFMAGMRQHDDGRRRSGLTRGNPENGTMQRLAVACIIANHLFIRIKGYKPDVQLPLHF